jgi:hypothetical protein
MVQADGAHTQQGFAWAWRWGWAFGGRQGGETLLVADFKNFHGRLRGGRTFLVTARLGGTSKRQAKASGRKPFFFEKNQKTFAKLGRAYPDRPKPK